MNDVKVLLDISSTIFPEKYGSKIPKASLANDKKIRKATILLYRLSNIKKNFRKSFISFYKNMNEAEVCIIIIASIDN